MQWRVVQSDIALPRICRRSPKQKTSGAFLKIVEIPKLKLSAGRVYALISKKFGEILGGNRGVNDFLSPKLLFFL